MTADARVTAIVDCGFTPRQARFSVAVMLHAGVCLARQYDAVTQLPPGQERHDFFHRLIRHRWARRHPCPDRRAHLYHLHGLRLYRAIGAPHHRHRRLGSLGRAVERLMRLDAILMAPDISWCASVEEQRALLAGRCGLDHVAGAGSWLDDVLRPRPGHAGDRPAIGVRTHDGAVVFLYLATASSPTRFRTYLRQHAELLRVVPRWTIRLVLPPQLGAAAAAYRTAFQHAQGTSITAADATLESVVLTQRYHGLAPLTGTA